MSRHRRLGRVGAAGLAAAAALGAVGCGIPTDDSPRAISRENVPDAVDDTSPTATEATSPADIFLVQSPGEDARLVERERDVAVDSPSARPTPDAVLEALLTAEPDSDEREDGIANLIPQDTRLASPPELAGTTLVIDLTRAIFDVVGEPQRAAFGQIVCTADGLAGVDSVQFRVDGNVAEAQADSGATDRPVTCARDYSRLLAEQG